MYATVVAVDDDGLVLEIAPGVEARFVKQAIMQIVDEGNAADDVDDDDELDVDRPEDADEPATPQEKAASKSSSKPSA
jgi:preprotein translocase subunit YajC